MSQPPSYRLSQRQNQLPTYEEAMETPSPPSYRMAMYDDSFPLIDQIRQTIAQENIIEPPPTPPNNPNFVGYLRPPSSSNMTVVFPRQLSFFGLSEPSAAPAPPEPSAPPAPPAPSRRTRETTTNRLRRMFNLQNS
jgi:hypothetical protein